MQAEGYEVTSVVVDVSKRESVTALAEKAASLGEVRYLVHTAGINATQGPVTAILAVNLLGVALVTEEFGKVIAPDGAGIVISSMAGSALPPFTAEQALALANTPADKLLDLPFAAPGNFPDSARAYAFSKRANQLRVQAANVAWGAREARINSISSGTIATSAGRAELDGPHSSYIKAMIDASNAKRPGTAADIATAIEFLLSPSAWFISGTDLLVDGGALAALQTGHVKFAATSARS